MFKYPGKEIKARMVGHAVWKATEYGLIGMALSMFALGMIDEEQILWGIVVGVFCAVVGYAKGREDALFRYAFGEMVDCVQQMKKSMCGDTKDEPTEVLTSDDYNVAKSNKTKLLVERKPNGEWVCSLCDTRYPAGTNYCNNCGLEVEFE